MPDSVNPTPASPAVPSFQKRSLDIRFTLAQGAFGRTGADTVDLKGLRASANISKPGGLSMSTLELRAYGVSLSTMNRLTILGKPLQGSAANFVSVTADGALCFAGTIAQAWVDADSAPEVSLIVIANTGGLDKIRQVPTSSYKGAVKAQDIIKDMASRLYRPLPVTNNGVDTVLTNGYYSGCLYDQMHDVARDGNFSLSFDDQEIAIWPVAGTRNLASTVVSADTGMVGYPMHTDAGISVQSLFNPALRTGDQIDVRTILTPAAGIWRILGLTHELESETTNGRWFTTMDCLLFDRPQVI